MGQERSNGYRAKLAITILYGSICAIEVWTYTATSLWHKVPFRPSYWGLAADAYCAYTCWLLARERQSKADRTAALLITVLFLAKVGAAFVGGYASKALNGIGCVAVAIGTVILILGFATIRPHNITASGTHL